MKRTMLRPLAGALAALLALAAPRSAAAYCDLIPGLSSPNTAYGLNYADDIGFHRSIHVVSPFWIAVGAMAYDPADDYDVSSYPNSPNPSPPDCYAPRLAISSATAGRTDFVVGDFNHNPTGDYVTWVHCYSGHCDSQPRGIQTWRDGELFYVDTPPVVMNISTLPDRIVKIWDVYLVAGTSYNFRFQSTGDSQAKMLLFRNPTGGVHWIGRSGAEFETAECVTHYSAPTTGYYGLVVVNDRYTSNPVTITLAVTTGPACACPGTLVSGIPQAVPANRTEAVNMVISDQNYWMAAGVRSSPSDWDLSVGHTLSTGPDAGCQTTVDQFSIYQPPTADVLAADFNFTNTLPDTFSIRANRYTGSGGAALEMDAGADAVYFNSVPESGYLAADDVVRVWDALMFQDTTYTVNFYPSVADMKLLVFANLDNSASHWMSRSNAIRELTGPATFVAPGTGYFGFAVVKDDAAIGSYTFSYGNCASPLPMAAKSRYSPTTTGGFRNYYSFQQPTSTWAAASVIGTASDWDLAQYSQPSGLGWPNCFGDPGAVSNAGSAVDLIVGDFHHMPLSTRYLHAYPYSLGQGYAVAVEWDPGSGTLQVNPPLPTNVTMLNSTAADRLWSYEVFMQAGFPYTVSFTHAGAADPHVLVFENASGSTFWAPRSSAALSTAVTTSYTPTVTGWHGVVVVNDNVSSGSFSLSILNSLVGVADPVTPERDGLQTLAPNPSGGPLRIDYALARAARPSFEILDVAGRLVSSVAAAPTGPGHWSVTWDGRGNRGEPLAGGLYLVRMSVDGRAVETRKLMRTN